MSRVRSTLREDSLHRSTEITQLSYQISETDRQPREGVPQRERASFTGQRSYRSQ